MAVLINPFCPLSCAWLCGDYDVVLLPSSFMSSCGPSGDRSWALRVCTSRPKTAQNGCAQQQQEQEKRLAIGPMKLEDKMCTINTSTRVLLHVLWKRYCCLVLFVMPILMRALLLIVPGIPVSSPRRYQAFTMQLSPFFPGTGIARNVTYISSCGLCENPRGRACPGIVDEPAKKTARSFALYEEATSAVRYLVPYLALCNTRYLVPWF